MTAEVSQTLCLGAEWPVLGSKVIRSFRGHVRGARRYVKEAHIARQVCGWPEAAYDRPEGGPVLVEGEARSHFVEVMVQVDRLQAANHSQLVGNLRLQRH